MTTTTAFGAKTRVTFNTVELIDLDSLEYPPSSPSDNDDDDDVDADADDDGDDEGGLRIQFDDEDDDEVNYYLTTPPTIMTLQLKSETTIYYTPHT